MLAAAYGRADYKRAIVVDGYGVRIAVDRNHLTIVDGIGSHRRTRTLTRSQTTVKRIVIVGEAGTISLAAIRWCVDTNVSIAQVTSEGKILAETVGRSPRESRLRRAQALTDSNEVGAEVAAYLIGEKIDGHARNLIDRLGDPAAGAQLLALKARVLPTSEISEIREIEAQAAAIYFKTWQRSALPIFASRDTNRVPEHWRTGNARTSRHWLTGRSPRKATDPVNAMLNYAYGLAEVECRIACVAVGLDPALGVMHADVKHRYSLALDLLEAVRPSVENHIMDVLATRRFRSVDFIETPDGTCRLTESVTHSLVEAMGYWARIIAPVAERVAHTIGASSSKLVRVRTPLTGERQRIKTLASEPIEVTRSNPVKAPSVVPFPGCVDCGRPLSVRRQKRCGDCEALAKVGRMTARAALGRAVRGSAAVDPSQTTAARAARIISLTESRSARDQWDAAHTVTNDERVKFTSEVIPQLKGIALQKIADAMGVSITSASLIRSGKFAPHARHWPALTRLLSERA